MPNFILISSLVIKNTHVDFYRMLMYENNDLSLIGGGVC